MFRSISEEQRKQFDEVGYFVLENVFTTDAMNEVIDMNERMAKEFDRVANVVGKEGRIKQRASLSLATGCITGEALDVVLLCRCDIGWLGRQLL